MTKLTIQTQIEQNQMIHSHQKKANSVDKGVLKANKYIKNQILMSIMKLNELCN